MGENQRKPSSRLGGLRGGGGGNKIVEVHGGRIVRSTGRKDRHSKVCTAKGPRDRRVRLSANTAIQFYDVQDRLGYDRPSKAVDWLINKAKIYIDKLDELPPCNPLVQNPNTKEDGDGDFGQLMESANDGSGFLPPSLDSDPIADTIKSFFPTSTPSSMSMQFQGYPPPPAPLDLLSRSTSSQSQDLNLSLQSFADPFLLPHHRNQTNHQNQQPFFSVAAAAASLGFDASAAVAEAPWSYQQSSDMNKFPKMVGWNTAGVDAASASAISSGGGGGFSFKSPPPVPQPMLVQSVQSGQLCFQRGPLQSSYAPPIRAWLDPSTVSSGAATAAVEEHQYHQMPPGNPMSLISSTGFSSGRYSGFQIPARIRGEEEHDDGAPNKPSSVSSNSRH